MRHDIDTHIDAQDRALLQRYRRGDGDAFEQLYRRYRDPLWRYCHACDPTHAEDLHQAVWLAVIRGHQRYDGRGTLRAWLFTVARHVVIDASRRRAPLADDAVDLETLPAAALDEPAAAALRRSRACRPNL